MFLELYVAFYGKGKHICKSFKIIKRLYNNKKFRQRTIFLDNLNKFCGEKLN